MIKHENQLLQLSSQNPPTWDWRNRESEAEVEAVEDVKENFVNTSPAKGDHENWNENYRRPDSLEIYGSGGLEEFS